jgi:hypothetical protein
VQYAENFSSQPNPIQNVLLQFFLRQKQNVHEQATRTWPPLPLSRPLAERAHQPRCSKVHWTRGASVGRPSDPAPDRPAKQPRTGRATVPLGSDPGWREAESPSASANPALSPRAHPPPYLDERRAGARSRRDAIVAGQVDRGTSVRVTTFLSRALRSRRSPPPAAMEEAQGTHRFHLPPLLLVACWCTTRRCGFRFDSGPPLPEPDLGSVIDPVPFRARMEERNSGPKRRGLLPLGVGSFRIRCALPRLFRDRNSHRLLVSRRSEYNFSTSRL